MHLENNDLIKFQMAAFSAIIHFHMADIYLVNRARWLDHYLITIKQSVSFRGRMHPENF